MTLTHITTHKEQMLARLLFQYKGKPNIQGIIEVLAARYQGLEDAGWQLATLRYIDTAEGVQLDVIGKIIRQPRGTSANDAEYRLRLKARMRVNQSSGTVEDILAVFAALLGGYTNLELTPYFPAGLILRINDIPISEAIATLYASFLRAARLGAVASYLHTSPTDAANTFTFPQSTTLTADHDGELTMHVVSTEGFLASGYLLLDVSDTNQLRVSYTYKTPTTFEGCNARDGVEGNRSPGSLVVQQSSPASELSGSFDVTSDVSIPVEDESSFAASGYVSVGPLNSAANYRIVQYGSKSAGSLDDITDIGVGGETLFLAGKIVAQIHQGFGSDGESFGGQFSSIVEA